MSHKLKTYKPGYSTSRRVLWVNNALAWGAIIAIVASALRGEAQAVAIASIVVPSLLALIAALLGIHRFAGVMDMRAGVDMARAHVEQEPPAPEDDAPAGDDDDAPADKRKGKADD